MTVLISVLYYHGDYEYNTTFSFNVVERGTGMQHAITFKTIDFLSQISKIPKAHPPYEIPESIFDLPSASKTQ